MRYVIYGAVEFPWYAETIRGRQLETVKAVADWMKKHGHAIEVEGHADPSETGPGLSRARAENVAALLRRYGVEPKRVLAVDKGASPPPEGVEQNSRVTFNFRNDLFGCQ